MNLWGIGFMTTAISTALLAIGYWAGRESRRRQRPATQRRQQKAWCENIAELTIEPAAPTVSPDFAPGRYIL